MGDYSLYSYQCCPIMPKPEKTEMFDEVTKESEQKAMDNMKNHQDILNMMLGEKLDDYFMNQKEREKEKGGGYEKCHAFVFGNKRYWFKVLLPKEGGVCDGVFMLRIANPRKTKREMSFRQIVTPDEPSALVIIDNRKDQQRILIEHTRAWRDTISVRNILRGAIGAVMRKHYQLAFLMEPVWSPNTFENLLRKYKDNIKSFEFSIGYPNMGRAGDNFLTPLKDSLGNIWGSATVKVTVPTVEDIANVETHRTKKEIKDTMRNSLMVDADNIDALWAEFADYCRVQGRTVKIGLNNQHQVTLGRLKKSEIDAMTPEQRKRYEENKDSQYSIHNVQLPDEVSVFDGQDDLFNGVQSKVMDKLQDLRRAGL